MKILTTDDETRDETLSNWPLLAHRRREKRNRIEHCLALFHELIQSPEDQREDLVRDQRFHSLDLVDQLLQESHCRQLSDPHLAQNMASLACQLAGFLNSEPFEARSAAARALCLEGNARRLRQDLIGADHLLARSVPFLQTQAERAYFCRFMGIVRWEQGRMDEADALLGRSLRLYTQEALGEEMAACNGLLGLLRNEEPVLAG